MAKQKIRDIIDRELIIRTNNVNYTQEFGTAGKDPNIQDIQGRSIFLTSLAIHEIAFVTVNGATQALGRDYTIEGEYTIKFNGIILKNRTVVVGYFYRKVGRENTKFPPVLSYFTSDNDKGEAGIIKFFFDIYQNNGENIYWSIHKDGEASPAKNPNGEELTGTSLRVLGVDGSKSIEYEVTYDEFLSRPGEKIPFTLVVIYDFTEDSADDEKLMATVTYELDAYVNPELNIDIAPADRITTAGTYDHKVTFSITPNSTPTFAWSLKGDGSTLQSGTEADFPGKDGIEGEQSVTHTFAVGSNSVPYTLEMVPTGGTMISKSDSIAVSIAPPPSVGKAGYIDDIVYLSASGTNAIENEAEFISRGAPEKLDLEFGVKSTPVDVVPTPDYVDGTPVFITVEVSKSDAPNGVKILNSISTDFTSSFKKIDGITRNSWIYIYNDFGAVEYAGDVSSIKIQKI